MKGWIIDYHNSATRDVLMILKDLGHEIKRDSLSNHMWAFNEEKSDIPFFHNLSLSDFSLDIGKYFSKYLNEDLKEYDFYVTGHTPCLSLLFSETDKPVIVLLSTRYEHPFTRNSENWKKFNEFLQERHVKKQFYFVANNHYDAVYFNYYTGIQPIVAQSICHYNFNKWKPVSKDWVLDSRVEFSNYQNLVKLKGTRYTFEKLHSYSGIVYVPYQASTMSLFEYAAAGIPVKYPTLDETLELAKRYPRHVMSELSWLQVENDLYNTEHSKLKRHLDLPSPNLITNEMLSYWLGLSDAYSEWMPNIIGNKSCLNNQEKEIIFKENYRKIMEEIAC